ncbi:hypothetical protein H4R34_000891 [Dimargaris verticillata]|uniref:Cytochrome c oxidase, subunit VIb n=1 Tax=Dimargaris verticillata TaxID=2761393 RepID=A0A9W8B5U2_9FUNG|nr:hypothetical protein H4R34_000891 [Dimargaris verticillata]
MASNASTEAFPKALNRAERKVCWKARDDLFACLDTQQKPTDDLHHVPAGCAQVYKVYESQCPPAWTDYFIKRRALEIKKAKQLEMMKRLPGNES